MRTSKTMSKERKENFIMKTQDNYTSVNDFLNE